MCASVRYKVLYINICLLICVSGEPMWICLDAQGSIQQQTGGDSSQSLCLTGGFAPTVSYIYTNALGFTVLDLFYEYLIEFIFRFSRGMIVCLVTLLQM